MYLVGLAGIGMCFYIFRNKIIQWIQEDEMTEMFKEKIEYVDIEMEKKLHSCSLCKIKIGKNMNMYCYMDQFFCSERCRSFGRIQIEKI
jgi:hypothetical protein